jgi:excisionase family DNA binding protein
MTKPKAGTATYNASELASKLGVSLDTLYEAVRAGECPLEPIRVGRRILWAKARVDELLGTSVSAGLISNSD